MYAHNHQSKYPVEESEGGFLSIPSPLSCMSCSKYQVPPSDPPRDK